MKTVDFKIADDKFVKLYHWDEVENAVGVVQIIHGMSEHMARYTRFAKFLNKNGWHVFGNDLRGCGFNVPKDKLGWDEGNMWESDIIDQLKLTEYIKTLYPKLPIAVLGHDYGSLLLQAYMPFNKSAKAFLMSGTRFARGFDVGVGRTMANLQFKRHGDFKRGQLLFDLTYNNCQTNFRNNGHWLTADETEMEKYKKDIRCGYSPSTNFFKWLFNGLKRQYKSDDKIDKGLPLLIFSGGDDAMGKFGKSVTKLHEHYQKVGMTDTELKLYPGGRHEMLNELNREEVFADVLKFLERVK